MEALKAHHVFTHPIEFVKTVSGEVKTALRDSPAFSGIGGEAFLAGPRTFWSEVAKIDAAGLPREVLRNTRDLYGKRQVAASGRPPLDLPRTNLSFRGHTLSLPSTVPYTTLALASKADVDETMNPYQFNPESRTAIEQLRMYTASLMNSGFPGMGPGFPGMGMPWGLQDRMEYSLHIGGV